jgi:hypothetical protein
MPIAALSIGAGMTVEDGGLRDFQVGQSQDRFRAPALFFPITFLLHGLWPPNATGQRSNKALLGRAAFNQ